MFLRRATRVPQPATTISPYRMLTMVQSRVFSTDAEKHK